MPIMIMTYHVGDIQTRKDGQEEGQLPNARQLRQRVQRKPQITNINLQKPNPKKKKSPNCIKSDNGLGRMKEKRTRTKQGNILQSTSKTT